MDWSKLDMEHVWHPFTQMAEWDPNDMLVIERAEGNCLIDVAGRRYLDGVSSLWVNVHGHNRPEINRAIMDQLGRVAHTTLLGLASPPSIELAARLVSLAPKGLTHVFYSDSGSSAVEIALKQAFQYWQHRGKREKTRFGHLDGGYHGDTLGAVGVGGIDLFHQVFGPLLVPGVRLACPAKVGLDAALEQAESILRRHGDELAAVIVEPLIQGAAGMLVHPRGYLRGLADLCRKQDVLLIVDEVATGFGRTGTMFACEQEQVSPDLMCLAKGITGGYLPLAATLSTDAVFEAFLGPRSAGKTFFHGHTYTGNPLACAAANASLALFEQDQVLARLPDKIEALSALLDRQIRPLPSVGEIRQCGLMIGIELGGVNPADATGARVCRAARDHGVILRPLGDVIVLMPPLSVTHSELEQLVSAVRAAIGDVLGMIDAFVTGTDTGVGKTAVCAGLLAAARRLGVQTAVMKPVESGVEPGTESDAALLLRASGHTQPMDEVCLYSFPEPIAPGVAAAAKGMVIDLLRVARGAGEIRARDPELFLIEGAGGLLVPLGGGHQIADLARLLGMPLLVVARDGLGTINHTLLTVEAARARGLTVRGVVLVSTDGLTTSERIESNMQEIERAGGVQVLGRVPYLAERSLDALADACEPILGALMPELETARAG